MLESSVAFVVFMVAGWHVVDKPQTHSVCRWAVVHPRLGEYGRYNSRPLAANVAKELSNHRPPYDADQIFEAACNATPTPSLDEQKAWWERHSPRFRAEQEERRRHKKP
jgi:hypothetical protein